MDVYWPTDTILGYDKGLILEPSTCRGFSTGMCRPYLSEGESRLQAFGVILAVDLLYVSWLKEGQ